MKKFLSLILSIALILAMGSMLFSCDETDTEVGTGDSNDTSAQTEAATEAETAVAHTCAFDTTKYASDDTSHWYACTTENCTSQDQKADHTFGTPVIEQTAEMIRRTYTCEFCKHQKVEETKISSVIENEASWDEAFSNLEFVNYSIIITMTIDGQSQVNKVEVGADAAHYLIQDSIEYYTMKNADGTWSTYMRNTQMDTDYEGYVKIADTTDKYYKATITESVIDISFKDNFEKFTYNSETGEYTCADQINASVYGPNGESYGTIGCFNNVIKTADGKITHMEADYRMIYEYDEDEYIEDGVDDAHLRYYNIGITEVVVPQTIIDTAVEGELDDGNYGVEENENVQGDNQTNNDNTGECECVTGPLHDINQVEGQA